MNSQQLKDLAEKEAYDDGYRAYVEDRSYDDNPYNNNDEWNLLVAWNEGYSDAGWDD